jgi:hypothetical protein
MDDLDSSRVWQKLDCLIDHRLLSSRVSVINVDFLLAEER